MKYLVMVGAKHTAKMSYCAISQNHPRAYEHFYCHLHFTRRRTRQREGPVQSTSLGHTASKWLPPRPRPYLLDSRAQYFSAPPHPTPFFFFCLLDLYAPSVFYSKFLFVPFLFQSFFIHSDYLL